MKKSEVVVPGTKLKECMDAYQVSAAKLADDINLSQSIIRQIVANKAKISLNIAKRLAKYFDTTVQFWFNLQTVYELSELDKDAEFNKILKNIPKAKKPAPGSKKAANKPAKKTGKAGRPAAGKKTKAPAKAKAAKGTKAVKSPKAKTAKSVARKAPKKATARKAPKKAVVKAAKAPVTTVQTPVI
ncbi:MAG: HigA family addiction module antidote protein [Treponema sp.]|nr:HigA family addiction module antidote protein [Treponema sp.]